MKKTIQTLLMAAMMLPLPFAFTSCDDFLGHWDKSIDDLYTPTTFKVWNATTNSYEKMDLSNYDFKTLTPATVSSLISGGHIKPGKYLVEGNVKYTGDVFVDTPGNTLEIYLQDNASFTITGRLEASDIDGVKIVGQKAGTGKMNITASGLGVTANTLTIDGGKIEVTSANVALNVKQMEAYGGSVLATSTDGPAIEVSSDEL